MRNFQLGMSYKSCKLTDSKIICLTIISVQKRDRPMSTSPFATTMLFRKLKGRSLGVFLLEVSAIIIGLTVSFMIDEWRQEQKQRKQEIEILKSIAEDLKADREFAHQTIAWSDLKI